MVTEMAFSCTQLIHGTFLALPQRNHWPRSSRTAQATLP
jgi:hypothetical protein